MPQTASPVYLGTTEWVILACFAGMYLAALLAFLRLGTVAFRNTKEGGAKSFGLLFERAAPFMVVAAMLLAVVALSALGKLTDNVTTLLASLASFALGVGGKSLSRPGNVSNKKKNKSTGKTSGPKSTSAADGQTP